jgi:hypothetical protein
MRCQKGKCGSVPFTFAQAPALKPVAQADDEFPPVGFAALISYITPTPTHAPNWPEHDDKSLQSLHGHDPVADEWPIREVTLHRSETTIVGER